jgi:hypothetical protein
VVGHVDSEIAQHVWPVLAFVYSGGKDNIKGSNDGSEQSDYSGKLQDIVDAGEGPMILSGEKEMEEENDDESEDYACEENLNWQ